jgi:hypothetical protein
MKKIFLSHVHEETPLALVLKEWIEDGFYQQYLVFVSSTDITSGDEWRKEIKAALADTDIFVSLCSPQSIYRPWIQFEAGSAWIKNIPVIPICHSGMTEIHLPKTLQEFQSLTIEEHEFGIKLIKDLAKRLNGFSSDPKIDVKRMMDDISKAIASIKYQDNLQQSQAMSNEFDDLAIKILKAIANGGNGGMALDQIATMFEISKTKAQHCIDNLMPRGKELLDKKGPYTLTGVPATYKINKLGRDYLYEKGLLD